MSKPIFIRRPRSPAIVEPHRGRRAPFCACGCAARVHRHEQAQLGHCGACGLGACPSYLPVNPRLPPHFDDTPNSERPISHAFWWDRPFIRTDEGPPTDRASWLEAWASGRRFEVRCLDGGAWDRSSSWGMFATLDEAIECVRAGGPPWRSTLLRLRAAGMVAGPPLGDE